MASAARLDATNCILTRLTQPTYSAHSPLPRAGAGGKPSSMTIGSSESAIGDSDLGVSDGSSGVAVGERRVRIILGLGKGPPGRYSS